MAELKRVKLMRGNESSRLSVTPAQGEQISTIDELKLYLGDGNKAGGFIVSADNTIAVWPDQTDATKKLSLAWWIAYFNGNEATIRIPRGTHEVLYDMTIPENICLKFDKGASLTVAETKTLTINGAIEAGLWQIFDGLGVVVGSPKVQEAYLEWFGAVGDGETDDGAILQKTLNFNPQTIHLLDKTYISTQHITIQYPIVIKGQGKGKSVLKVGNAYVEGTDHSFIKLIGTVDGVSFENFTIDGNKANNPGADYILLECGSGLETVISTNILLCNMEIKNSPYHGIYLTEGTSHVLMNNCWLHDNGQVGGGNEHGSNIYTASGSYYKFTDCIFENAYEHGAYLVSDHVDIINCKFINNGGAGLSYRSNDGHITNCIFTGSGAAGLELKNLSNVNVHDNRIYNNCCSFTANELLFENCKNLIISGNYIGKAVDNLAGIEVKFNVNKENILFSNNVVHFKSIALMIQATNPGGESLVCNNVKIADNIFIGGTISGSPSIGIYVLEAQTGDGLIITGNTFKNVANQSIRLDAPADIDNVIVLNNNYINCRGAARYLNTGLGEAQWINYQRQTSAESPPVLGTTAEVEQTWRRGDIVWNTDPTPGAYIGWVLLYSSGYKWKGFGLLES